MTAATVPETTSESDRLTRPTYTDLRTYKTLSAGLLEARIHTAGTQAPRGYLPLGTLIDRFGGSYTIGDEPGSDTYDERSPFRLIRTGALGDDRADPCLAESGIVGVRQHAFVSQGLRSADLLIAKDGPVGAVGLMMDPSSTDMISSGLVRICLARSALYLFAVLKYGAFTPSVDLLTPRSSAYRHADLPLIMDSLVPDPDRHAATAARLTLLAACVLACERTSARRVRGLIRLIDTAVGTTGLLVGAEARAVTPSFNEVISSGRLDARRHEALMGDFGTILRGTTHQSLRQLEEQGALRIRRAQNLQVSAIGFSEKHDDPRVGSYRLIEPNMIRRDMTVPRSSWLSCPRRLNVLPDTAVLMSAEGSIGNVALYQDEPQLRTVGNIHMFVIEPVDDPDGLEAAALGATLVWLREKGWLEAVSAGGQGGSLGKNYHADVLIPTLSVETKRILGRLLLSKTAAPTASQLSVMPLSALRKEVRSIRRLPLTAIDSLRRHAEEAIIDVLAAELPDAARR